MIIRVVGGFSDEGIIVFMGVLNKRGEVFDGRVVKKLLDLYMRRESFCDGGNSEGRC